MLVETPQHSPIQTWMMYGGRSFRTINAALMPSGKCILEDVKTKKIIICQTISEAIHHMQELEDALSDRFEWRVFHLDTFDLLRKEDETGVSGTGHVASGVVFLLGQTALEWRVSGKSLGIYENEDVLLDIHGHGGRTQAIHHKKGAKNG